MKRFFFVGVKRLEEKYRGFRLMTSRMDEKYRKSRITNINIWFASFFFTNLIRYFIFFWQRKQFTASVVNKQLSQHHRFCLTFRQSSDFISFWVDHYWLMWGNQCYRYESHTIRDAAVSYAELSSNAFEYDPETESLTLFCVLKVSTFLS